VGGLEVVCVVLFGGVLGWVGCGDVLWYEGFVLDDQWGVEIKVCESSGWGDEVLLHWVS